MKGSPEKWGRIVTSAYERHAADMVVGEVNYGGDMVRFTIQTARPNTPFKTITSSRGKHIRAEPIAALYEQNKVRHVGHLSRLEDELVEFTTAGYSGAKSPNRADAMIFAVSELFPGMVRKKRPAPVIEGMREYNPLEW